MVGDALDRLVLDIRGEELIIHLNPNEENVVIYLLFFLFFLLCQSTEHGGARKLCAKQFLCARSHTVPTHLPARALNHSVQLNDQVQLIAFRAPV
jgi:hypothetical protein